MAVTNYAALPSIVHAQGSLDGCLSLFLLGGCLGVRLCGMFNTLEPVKLVPEVLYYFMFPQHYVGVPVLPHPCLTLNIVRFFYYNHSSESEVVSCGFNLHFPND